MLASSSLDRWPAMGAVGQLGGLGQLGQLAEFDGGLRPVVDVGPISILVFLLIATRCGPLT